MGGCGASWSTTHKHSGGGGRNYITIYYRSRWKSKATVVSIDRGKEFFRSHSQKEENVSVVLIVWVLCYFEYFMYFLILL